MQYLTIWDLLLTPIYILLIAVIAKRRRDRKYPPGHPLRKYYMPGLYAKFGGAIAIGLIYQYYYGNGDTFNFFAHAKIINSALSDSISTWWKLILRTPTESAPEVYSYASQMYWYYSPSDYAVAVITAILGLFTFTTYLPTALLFAYFAFTGIWAMYVTFVRLYPKLVKPLALAFLFLPSTVIWGSGIFKDTICMFGLGWLTYSTFRLFINKDFSIKTLILIALSFYLIAVIKLYILLGFVPALILWLMLTYTKRIQLVALRWMTNLFILSATAIAMFFFMQRFAEELNKYSLEKIAKTAATTRGWIAFASQRDEGSAYDLGDFEPTLGGMLKKFPQAVVVTLFRPFLWESKKIIVLLSALEATAFLMLTVKLFAKGKTKLLVHISKDPNLMFFIVFTLIFAFAVGISSYNFGALSRYKIPCLPFFAAFIVISFNYSSATQSRANFQPKRPRNLAETASTL